MSHYETLGVPRDASADEIKSAFRRKSKECHPDKGGTNEAMSALNVAYAVLSDPTRRKVYDETGRDTEGPSIDQQAAKVLIAVFTDALANALVGDPIAYTRKELTQTITAARRDQPNVRETIKSLKKRRDRVRVKKGDNLMHMLIDKQVQEREKTIAHMELVVEVGTAALTLLDDYEYQSDGPEGELPQYAQLSAFEQALTGRTFR